MANIVLNIAVMVTIMSLLSIIFYFFLVDLILWVVCWLFASFSEPSINFRVRAVGAL